MDPNQLYSAAEVERMMTTKAVKSRGDRRAELGSHFLRVGDIRTESMPKSVSIHRVHLAGPSTSRNSLFTTCGPLSPAPIRLPGYRETSEGPSRHQRAAARQTPRGASFVHRAHLQSVFRCPRYELPVGEYQTDESQQQVYRFDLHHPSVAPR